jgi:HSP20 family protein
MLRSIFDDLYDLNREMNKIFTGNRYYGRRNYWAETNVYENNDGYVLISKLPGISKEDVAITLKDNSLKISGERKKEKVDGEAVHLEERFSGKFERSFLLNDKINSEGIEAEMTNGLLMVKLPKSPETKPRKIEIK